MEVALAVGIAAYSVDKKLKAEMGGADDASATAASATADVTCPSNLRILVCTGNLGNAAPTKESFAAWLPKHGSVDEVLQKAKYPPPVGHDPPTEADMGGWFDIIAIGMQEAVFSIKKEDSTKTAAALNAIPEVTERDVDVETNSSNHKVSLSNLKLMSMRGLLPQRGDTGAGGSDHSLSDDSMMSLMGKDNGDQVDIYSEGNGRANGEDDDNNGPPDNRIHMQSSRDGPMPGSGKKNKSPTPSPKAAAGGVTNAAKKATNAVTGTVDGVVNVAKEKLVHPVATTIVSVAGNADHTRGQPPPGAGGQSHSTAASFFGLDTILDGAKPAEWVGGTKELYDIGDEQLGTDNYDALVRYQRGEMRLVVLVRKELSPLITNIETLAENTGIAGVVANKGGIISTLTIAGKTRISFLTAHLEAHEGKEHYNNRCSNLAEILSCAKKGSLDASITSHHMFAMGDLNFRVALPPPEGKEKWEGAVHRAKVRSMVDDEKWEALNDADELHSALKKGDCLAGFRTLQCNFHPTFKVHRELGFKYQEKRTPSYTDRILWKSAHGLNDDVRPLLYEPVSDYVTSDHKPMRGAYSVVMRGHYKLEGPGIENAHLAAAKSAGGRDRDLHLFISDMACKDLSRVWEARKNAPYIMFTSNPKNLIRFKRTKRQIIADKLGLGGYAGLFFKKSTAVTQMRDGYPRTSVNKENGDNPDWGDAEVKLSIEDPNIECAEDLAGALLYLNVYDKQGLTPNDDDYLIGTVALNLEVLAKEDGGDDEEDEHSPRGNSGGGERLAFAKSIMGSGNSAPVFDMIEIDEPIVKNGKEKGRLSCTITAWWLSNSVGRVDNLSARRSMRNIQGKKKKKFKWPVGAKKKEDKQKRR